MPAFKPFTWIAVLIVIAVIPAPGFAAPHIVPLDSVFKVTEVPYEGGELMMPGKDSSGKKNGDGEESFSPGWKKLFLSVPGSKRSYLLDGTCVHYDRNAIDLGDGRIVMACQSGGNHCCSTYVSLLKDSKKGTLKVAGSRTIIHPELGIDKESIGPVDSRGNLSIEVHGFTDRYDDDIEKASHEPSFIYYIKILKTGHVAVDRDVKAYENIIAKLKTSLSKSYDFEMYVQLVFYNRLLDLKLSENAYLSKASASEKGVAARGVKWIFEEMPFLRIINDDDGFALKPTAPISGHDAVQKKKR